MKTLVIHPKDPTTDFLSISYADTRWSIISNNVPNSYLKRQIQGYDRIIMMGHGTEQGLLGFSRYIIDSSLVYLLRDKICACIWCNADVFVKKYGLKGFYTGMIISEYEEALLYSVKAEPGEIEKSNELFADSLKFSLNSVDILGIMQDFYQGEGGIIEFNRNNLYQI